MRLVWINYRKTPQAPACWMGSETRDKYSRALSGEYGLAIGGVFIGVLTFYPKT